jgi:hypothetical protein
VVKPLWRELGYESQRLKTEAKETIEEVMDALWYLKKEQRIQIITMWWLWWKERNRVREGKVPKQIADLVYQVKCNAAEYICCYANDKVKAGVRRGKWQKPSDGFRMSSSISIV